MPPLRVGEPGLLDAGQHLREDRLCAFAALLSGAPHQLRQQVDVYGAVEIDITRLRLDRHFDEDVAGHSERASPTSGGEEALGFVFEVGEVETLDGAAPG